MTSLLKQEDRSAAEALRAWLAEQTFGSVRPVEVRLRRDQDSTGDEAWFVEVVLPNPDPDVGTWPVDDLIDLDRATRDKALEIGVSWPWYVLVKPETDEPQADEDELDSAGDTG